MRAGRALVGGLVLAAGVSGCSSTRDKADAVQQQGSDAFKAKGLRLTASNTTVKVGRPVVLKDANGIAVVVELRNTSPKALGDVPLAVTVSDAADKPVWRNDSAGVQPSLASVGYLPAGKAVTWVNDQVQVAVGTPKAAAVQAGEAKARGGDPVAVVAEPPTLEQDPVSGVDARGFVRNDADADLKDVVVTGVGRRGDQVVAAGRAVIPRIKAKGRVNYVIFFIGDPRGTELSVVASPTSTAGG